MEIIHKKINFTDERGTITDVFVNDCKDHAAIIYCKKGAVRGNHYHRESTQYTFVVSGQLTVLNRNAGEKEIAKHILRPNDMATHSPMEAHTLIADEDTIFLAFVDGKRGGENYEKDTYRLKVPLEKIYKEK